MTVDVAAIAQAGVVAIFVLSLADVIRRPSRVRADVALFFGVAAIAFLSGSLAAGSGRVPAFSGSPSLVAILAMPYIVLRLLDDLVGAARWVMRASEAGLIAGAVALFALGSPMPRPELLALASYFLAVAAYATWGFVREAASAVGLRRQRMEAIGAGSGLFASGVLLLAAGGLFLTTAAGVIAPLSQALFLGAVLAYYAGFAPPPWLRRVWREPVLVRLLASVGELVRLDDEKAVLRRIERVTAAAVSVPADHVSVLSESERERSAPPDGAIEASIRSGVDRSWVLRVSRGRRTIFEDDDRAIVRLIANYAEVALETRSSLDQTMARRLDRSQRLESLGQLAGGIAHDFNNLLSIILNYARIVQDQLPPDGSLHSEVDEIRQAAERAAALTRQLLIFGRRQLSTPGPLDLAAVVGELDGLLRRTLGERIDLETHVGSPLGAVRIDRGHVEQVLANLAINARDAMPAGGKLIVQLTNIEIDAADADRRGVGPGKYVELSVSDTGTGMPPEVRDRVFEPFFTTKPVGQGTGLGLSTVYGIVTQAGGRIQVYSEVDHGTVFRVLFPATADALISDTPVERQTPLHGSGETILLVEDEARLGAVTARILRERGFEVLVAADPEKAMGISREDRRIDLLLTDLVMPRMSGRELAARLGDERPGLRVVFMSGYTQEILEHKGELSAPLVEKPFTAESLLTQVRAVLDRTA